MSLLIPEGLLLSALVEGRHIYRSFALLSDEGLAEGNCTCRRPFPCPHLLALLLDYQEDPGSFADLTLVGSLLEEVPSLWQQALEDFLRQGPEASFLEMLWERVRASHREGERWLHLQPLRPRAYALQLWREAKDQVLSTLPPSSPKYALSLARLLLWGRKLQLVEADDLWGLLLGAFKGRGTGEGDPSLPEAVAPLLGYLSEKERGLLLRLLSSLSRGFAPQEKARFASLLEKELAQAHLYEIASPGKVSRRPALAAALARWYRLFGRHREELSVWQRHGDLPLAPEGKVRALEAMKDWPAMAEEAKKGLREAPAEKVFWFRRQWARALMAQGRHEEAWPLFLLNFEEGLTWRAYQDLKEAAQKAGQWDGVRLRAARLLARAYWPPKGREMALKVAGALAQETPLLGLRYLKACREAWPEMASLFSDAAQALLDWGPPSWKTFWEGEEGEEGQEEGE
ncbi:MAG: SWIM zinc finger family protein [Bacillota bacterium]|nr:SWIM zinc finger family protein [Bacillota bacterium]